MNENFDVIYQTLFRRYYPSLIFYATRLVGEEDAEDVVQDVFVELWRRKNSIEIGDQIQAFLYRAVYTRALNVLKHRNVEDGYCAAMEEINQRRAEFYQPDNNEVIQQIEDRELRKEIYDAINELPDKCKEVFKLSYLHDMKNKEIAERSRSFAPHGRSAYVQGFKVLAQPPQSALDNSSLIFMARLVSVFVF